jgi:hypothetical protein
MLLNAIFGYRSEKDCKNPVPVNAFEIGAKGGVAESFNR